MGRTRRKIAMETACTTRRIAYFRESYDLASFWGFCMDVVSVSEFLIVWGFGGASGSMLKVFAATSTAFSLSVFAARACIQGVSERVL